MQKTGGVPAPLTQAFGRTEEDTLSLKAVLPQDNKPSTGAEVPCLVVRKYPRHEIHSSMAQWGPKDCMHRAAFTNTFFPHPPSLVWEL